MASIGGTKIKRPRRTINLCRICLTHSPSMRELSQNLENFCEILTIQEILEKVMCCEILITKKSPNQICSVCLSLLRISYELKNQFENSQKKLFGNLSEIKKKSPEAEVKNLNEVELIVGNNNYNLDDLVIVEDEENKHKVTHPDYTQFLDNLGKTVTVEYLGKLRETKTEAYYTMPSDEEDFSNIQMLSDDISKNALENEDYETIIIQCISDTEEISLSQRDHMQIGPAVEKSKCSPSLMEKIDSLIIEDDSDEQHVVQNKGINNVKDENYLNPVTTMNMATKRKKKGTASKMEDIEKYIIYETDEEGRDNAHKESLQVSDPSCNEVVPESLMSEKNVAQINSEKDVSTSKNDIHSLGENENNSKQNKHFCKQCSTAFITRWTYKRHLLCVHGIKVGKAPNRTKGEKLPKEVQIKRRIQRLKERFKKNPLLCQICGHVSKSSGGAKYHSLTHGEKMFKCDLCPKKFYTPSHLKNHFQNKHERKLSPHLCSICGENRNSSTALAYHMKLHANDSKKFSCPICDVSFLMKSGLSTHIRRHLGDRRYPCNICDKSFFSGNERKKHMMIHTGERPHKCKYCERRFVTPFNQKIHMMTHTGPFSCKICFKGLVDEDMLKLHVKTKHCASLSDTMEVSEYTEADVGERYDKYELLIQSPGNCPENVILEDLSLLDVVEDDSLDFDGD